LCALGALALAALAALAGGVRAEMADTARAEEELRDARRLHVIVSRDPVQRTLLEALEDARAAQVRYYEREREVEALVIVEESLVHRDRRYVAEGKPAALARKLAAEQAQAAADRRLRRWGKWAKRRYPIQVRQAELWTIDAVAAELYRNERFRREVCRKVLDLAEKMEREAGRRRRPVPPKP
jgi:predicted metal-dependent hydrolase